VSWLAPLSLAQLGALLTVAFGLLAWLHLRTPRPQRTRVAFLDAWDEVAPQRAGRPAKWALTKSWPLLRAIAIVTLIGVALVDPKPSWLASPARTTLLVLDAGAHMRATDEKPSRFERARELASGLLEQQAAGDRVMVAQLDSTLTALSGWSETREWVQLQAAVGAARLSHEATRFEALSRFAREQLRGKPGAEVLLVSDGAFEIAPSELTALRDAGVELRQLKVGQSADNLAIRAFAVRAYPWGGERCEALVELENTGPRPRDVELALFEEGRPIDVRPFRLEARSRVRKLLEFGATGARFSARISAKTGVADAQPLDDEAYAVLAQAPPRRVLLVTEGQRYLESALALDRRLLVEKQAPGAYRSAQGYDLVIFDRFVPSEPPGVATLWLAPSEAAPATLAPYRVLGSIDRPFFDEARSDEPLLRSVSLRDVNIRRAQRAQLEPNDEVLARSKLGPLIVKGLRAGVPFIALTFDVRESDLVLRTGWPILVSQLVRELTAAGSAALDVPLQLGRLQSRDVTASGEVSAKLRAPSGKTTDLDVRGQRVQLTPEEPGFYELRSAGSLLLMAANVGSDAPATIEPREWAPAPAPDRPLRRSWHSRGAAWSLLFGALLVLALEVWRSSRGWKR
jgi:hypothetical protein